MAQTTEKATRREASSCLVFGEQGLDQTEDTGSVSQTKALILESLTVKADRIVCELLLAPGFPHASSPQLAKLLCARFPQLAFHTCRNTVGNIFSAVADHTSIPHLLEHLVIELQVQNSQEPETTYVGTSEWIDKKAGRARIEVSFTDDLSALRAFRDASDILNKALLE